MNQEKLTVTSKMGDKFSEIATEPFVGKDGALTTVRVWEGHCRKCGAAFQFALPIGAVNEAYTSGFGRAHCQAHKLTPIESLHRWKGAVR